MNRRAIRNLLSTVDESYRLELLYRAIDRLPEEQLIGVFGDLIRYCDRAALARPTPDVFEEVTAFVEESKRGAYYDLVDVGSQMEMSAGTVRWIPECCRLLGLLVDASIEGSAQDVAEAFDSIFESLRRINHGDDIVFLADEGGAWQVGVEWERVVPA